MITACPSVFTVTISSDANHVHTFEFRHFFWLWFFILWKISSFAAVVQRLINSHHRNRWLLANSVCKQFVWIALFYYEQTVIPKRYHLSSTQCLWQHWKYDFWERFLVGRSTWLDGVLSSNQAGIAWACERITIHIDSLLSAYKFRSLCCNLCQGKHTNTMHKSVLQ